MDKAINSLVIFFKDLKTKLTNSKDGSDFEDRIKDSLREIGFDKKMWKTEDSFFSIDKHVSKQEKQSIKKSVLDKNKVVPIKNNTDLIYIYISTIWQSKLPRLFNIHSKLHYSIRD